MSPFAHSISLVCLFVQYYRLRLRLYRGTPRQIESELAQFGICGPHLFHYIAGTYDLSTYWHVWIRQRIVEEGNLKSVSDNRQNEIAG
jgi:hypothetical protein